MHIKSVREVKPIMCSVCGCEFQWEVGDELLCGYAAVFCNCPVCGTPNRVEFGEGRIYGEESE